MVLQVPAFTPYSFAIVAYNAEDALSDWSPEITMTFGPEPVAPPTIPGNGFTITIRCEHSDPTIQCSVTGVTP